MSEDSVSSYLSFDAAQFSKWSSRPPVDAASLPAAHKEWLRQIRHEHNTQLQGFYIDAVAQLIRQKK